MKQFNYIWFEDIWLYLVLKIKELKTERVTLTAENSQNY